MSRKSYFALITVMVGFMSVVALSASSAGAAEPPKAAPGANEPSKAEAARMQRNANQAAAKIQRSKAALEEFAAAVRSNNTAQVKEILSKNGLDAKDAKITLRDKTVGTSGPAERIKVHIHITCCPWTIDIDISW